TTLLLLTAAGFYLGRGRALAAAGATGRRLHSLPSHYGTYVALWCGIPSLVVLLGWLLLQPYATEWILRSNLPPEILALEPARLELLLAQARNIVQNRVSGAADPAILAALE